MKARFSYLFLDMACLMYPRSCELWYGGCEALMHMTQPYDIVSMTRLATFQISDPKCGRAQPFSLTINLGEIHHS